MAEGIMANADLEAFAKVSAERASQQLNLPGHIDSSKIDAAATSLASNLLKKQSATE